jgi:hypothetical protein
MIIYYYNYRISNGITIITIAVGNNKSNNMTIQNYHSYFLKKNYNYILLLLSYITLKN